MLEVCKQIERERAQLVEVYTQELDPKQEGAIAASRARLWLASGWDVVGRVRKRAAGRCGGHSQTGR
jgi:hypothetical protein